MIAIKKISIIIINITYKWFIEILFTLIVLTSARSSAFYDKYVTTKDVVDALAQSTTDMPQGNAAFDKHPILRTPECYQTLIAEVVQDQRTPQGAAIKGLSLLCCEKCDPKIARSAANQILETLISKRAINAENEPLLLAVVLVIGRGRNASDAKSLLSLLDIQCEGRSFKISCDFWLCHVLDAIEDCGTEEVAPELEKAIRQIAEKIPPDRLCQMAFVSKGFSVSGKLRERSLLLRLGAKCGQTGGTRSTK